MMQQQQEGCCPRQQQWVQTQPQLLLLTLSWCGWVLLVAGAGLPLTGCGGCCRHAAGVLVLLGVLLGVLVVV